MSATILTVIVLVVMWAVVLVPMLVRRADEPAALAPMANPPVRGMPAPSIPVSSEPAPRIPVPSQLAPSAPAPVRSSRAVMLSRRRRALTTLVLLAVASTAAAMALSGWLWLANGCCVTLLAAYLVWLRVQATRHIATHRTTTTRPSTTRPSTTRPSTTRPSAASPADLGRPRAPVGSRQHPHPASPSAQVVPLDDDDPSFAQLDPHPRAVNA